MTHGVVDDRELGDNNRELNEAMIEISFAISESDGKKMCWLWKFITLPKIIYNFYAHAALFMSIISSSNASKHFEVFHKIKITLSAISDDGPRPIDLLFFLGIVPDSCSP